MQKIVLHLWYNKETGEAASLYTSLFPDSSILSKLTMENTN
jgi:predicted 3-demethylubiquinone-9 3-methyltransferase (glyoxalase superfamily)